MMVSLVSAKLAVECFFSMILKMMTPILTSEGVSRESPTSRSAVLTTLSKLASEYLAPCLLCNWFWV